MFCEKRKDGAHSLYGAAEGIPHSFGQPGAYGGRQVQHTRLQTVVHVPGATGVHPHRRAARSFSVVLIKADAFDIIPRGGLMAEEALIHFGLFHVRDSHRNHFEMHHVMARRSLMALGARFRNG